MDWILAEVWHNDLRVSKYMSKTMLYNLESHDVFVLRNHLITKIEDTRNHG